MAFSSVYCSVLHADVTCVTDLEGDVLQVICTEYEGPTGACRLKARMLEGGPLSRLLERVSEQSLETRSPQCILRAA